MKRSLPDVDMERVSFSAPDHLSNLTWNDLCVFVDPLDGTKQFCLANFHAVNVLIGVVCKGVPSVGVIHEPWYVWHLCLCVLKYRRVYHLPFIYIHVNMNRYFSLLVAGMKGSRVMMVGQDCPPGMLLVERAHHLFMILSQLPSPSWFLPPGRLGMVR